MTAGRSRSVVKIAWTANPLPWRGTGTTLAPAAAARAAVASVELLSKTKISASGSTRRQARTKSPMAAASL
jgi:hypothetical protein